MDFTTFMRLARMYSKMGWSVQGQLDNILDGEDLSEQNPNALKMIQELLQAFEKATEGGDEDSFTLLDEIKEHLGEQ